MLILLSPLCSMLICHLCILLLFAACSTGSLPCALSLCLQEIWYQLAFEGYPASEAEWFPANRIRTEYPSGRELIESFEVCSSSSSSNRRLWQLQ